MGNILKYFYCYALFANTVIAQDEVFLRNMFSNDLIKKNIESKIIKKHYTWKVHSDYFEIDLTEDGFKEGIIVEKKDGEDWVHIHNTRKKRIKSFSLDSLGINSKVYKISFRNISDKTKVLLIYYYEGMNSYLEFTGSARLYFITIDKNNINSSSLYKGPTFLDERDDGNRHYHNKKYHVFLYDYNKDGIKEIGIKYNNISRIYMYVDYGKWKKI